jgi:hypothetical protein
VGCRTSKDHPYHAICICQTMRLQTPSKTGTLCVKQRSDQSNVKSKAPDLGSSQVKRPSVTHTIERAGIVTKPASPANKWSTIRGWDSRTAASPEDLHSRLDVPNDSAIPRFIFVSSFETSAPHVSPVYGVMANQLPGHQHIVRWDRIIHGSNQGYLPGQ